ncbi:hypothetical protein [Streptomyces sp. NPDC004546]
MPKPPVAAPPAPAFTVTPFTTGSSSVTRFFDEPEMINNFFEE